jgi:hypothetical protein
MSQEWGFTVQRIDRDYEWKNPDGTMRDQPLEIPADPPRWQVYLPHQCDSWAILTEWAAPGTENQTSPWPWMTGGSQADAVAALERFIAEAQEALAALKAGQEYGDPGR